MVRLPFANREAAGRALAAELARRGLHRATPSGEVIVLALPRGGVPVGREVAHALHAPLDVVIVRKLGVPWQRELAMGAIAGGGFQTLDESLVRELRVSREEIEATLAKERRELERREKLYRGHRPAIDVHSRTVVLVDDGLATGSTMLVAARYVKSLKPARLVVAVPLGSAEACEKIRAEAVECVCLATPEPFVAVGEWYADFPQTSDAEVQQALEEFAGSRVS
jgi:putative phosphoribosyl transferase